MREDSTFRPESVRAGPEDSEVPVVRAAASSSRFSRHAPWPRARGPSVTDRWLEAFLQHREAGMSAMDAVRPLFRGG